MPGRNLAFMQVVHFVVSGHPVLPNADYIIFKDQRKSNLRLADLLRYPATGCFLSLLVCFPANFWKIHCISKDFICGFFVSKINAEFSAYHNLYDLILFCMPLAYDSFSGESYSFSDDVQKFPVHQVSRDSR